MAPALGTFGVWGGQLRFGDPGEIAEAAAELEQLGYGALWFPGGAGGDVFGAARHLLSATERVTVATGILNLWAHDPDEVAAEHARLTADHPDRFLLGIGISHSLLVERLNQSYERPLARTAAYLDRLDEASPPVPRAERALAALGPKMLRLAAERTAGAHPYLVPPEHTAVARATLGAGPLLAPEQKVVLERDPARARATARASLAMYLQLPNYTNNLLRTGFTPEDLADGGSDRLVDGIVAWGDDTTIAARVQDHLDAGADHVCVQVLQAEGLPLPAWRELAPALGGLRA